MQQESLTFKWSYRTNTWEQQYCTGGQVYELDSLADLSRYLEMPFAGTLEGTAYLESSAGDGSWSVTLPVRVTYEEEMGLWTAETDGGGGVIPDFPEAVRLAVRLTGGGFPTQLLPDWNLEKIQGCYQVGTDGAVGTLTAKLIADGVWNLF